MGIKALVQQMAAAFAHQDYKLKKYRDGWYILDVEEYKEFGPYSESYARELFDELCEFVESQK
jgi:hypothetical protein